MPVYKALILNKEISVNYEDNQKEKLEEAIKEINIKLKSYDNLNGKISDSKLLSFAPEAVDHLIEIIRNKKNKDYVRKDAIIGFFQIRKDAILDKENKDEIKE